MGFVCDCFGNAIEQFILDELNGQLMSETDPVLAELWDNDDDAIYEDM